jgi:hypothetical protein
MIVDNQASNFPLLFQSSIFHLLAPLPTRWGYSQSINNNVSSIFQVTQMFVDKTHHVSTFNQFIDHIVGKSPMYYGG